jgi:glycosyltransferase involved in cell wall biosynthesis
VKLDSVYVNYWSLRDPLCQSQSLPVVRALVRRGWRVGLLTYEHPAWRLAPADEAATQAQLEKEGVHWYPLVYHKRPAVASTLFDILVGARCCVTLAGRAGVQLFHGRGSVPGAIACLASRWTRRRFFNDADGPLSEEYVDAGIWKRGSLPHRLTGLVESWALASADAVAVLSQHRRCEVEDRTHGSVTVLSCAVDTELFSPAPEAGIKIRQQLGLSGIVLVYAGKAGGWYPIESMMDFAKAAACVQGDVSLLVLTTGDPRSFVEPAVNRGLRCVVRSATRVQMPDYLSAGDVGLSFRLNTPSQRACSPIKNGEYLACGLPIVSTAGSGDYDELVASRRVGVVVERLDEASLRKAALELKALLSDRNLRHRCRLAAVEEVGLHEKVVPKYIEIYERLLGPPIRSEP